jgi:hypothetical protein
MPHPLAFQPVAIDDDQQSVTVGGHKFVAQANDTGSCKGCAFPDGFGCALWRSNKGTLCRSKDREDEREIIWVPAHTVKGSQ